MRHALVATAMLFWPVLACAPVVAGEASPSSEAAPKGAIPRAVKIARTTAIPKCSQFVDAAGGGSGTGSAQEPHETIAAAVAAASPGAVICVAEGTYAENLAPGTKPFTLAGGFQRGTGFRVRDSAKFASKAKGNGGSFLRIADPGPMGDQLTAIDGFEISGYEQAIVRDYYESQRFDITNNFIHDNTCKNLERAGGGFALSNVSGTIKGNVIARNACGRGGAGFVNDDAHKNTVSIENNWIDGNAGTEPGGAHGGGLYVFAKTLAIVGNTFTNNRVTHWGAGLYVGAYTEGGVYVTATLAWNVYRGNRAGNTGGGFFCDDGATCNSDHEVYEGNCGANIYLDSGSGGPTTARFDHLTNIGALDVDCQAPGPGVRIDAANDKADVYTFTNAIFKGNAKGGDFVTGCDEGCESVKVKVTVAHSVVQREYVDGGVKVSFGDGIVPPNDEAPGKTTERHDEGGATGQNGSANQDPEQTAEPGAPTPEADVAADDRTGKGAAAHGAAGHGAPAPSADAGVRAGGPGSPPAQAADANGDRTEPAADDGSAPPPPEHVSVKEAFQAAKELGTVEAWSVFLNSYPKGFHADLARAYLKNLARGSPAAPPATKGAAPDDGASAPPPPSPADAPGKQDSAKAKAGDGVRVTGTEPGKPAVARGGRYMGFAEQFNRYYTDPAWKAAKTVYVSPTGGGDGATRETPMAVQAAVADARPGTRIYFLRGAYKGGLEFTKTNSGSYDEPIVLYAERNQDKSIGVSMTCSSGTRATCFNLEDADYVAVDGFELIGGRYGVRAVGADYDSSKHSRGIAVLDSKGHDQNNDPFFAAQSDWAVWERNVAYGAKAGDGHGFYLNNGSDWNIVRFNETFSNVSSDFQVNADPSSTCKEAGIAFADPRCDAYAGTGEGGRGASDYFLVDSNFFHHGKGPGANFTSVRKSVIRNNVFGLHSRHNVSFWQETDNPKLGSSDNKVIHNLFVTTGRQGVQFINNSTRNEFANNVVVGVQVSGGKVTANPSAKLMEVDDTVGANVYRSNLYVSGTIEGRIPNDQETARADFSPTWFTKFPAALNHDPNDFRPTANAPFLKVGTLSADAPADRNGTVRSGQVDLGPIAVP